MKFDIIYVTYNSQKWIDACFESLACSNYRLDKINVYVVDNASTDNTINELKKIKQGVGRSFGRFEIIESKENLGFGKGNNLGFTKGDSEIVCFFNIDTEVFPDTLSNLKNEITMSKEEVGLWELRQFPYEHPKFYDIITGYTSWSSGAAFAMRRELYKRLNGFDEKIFMYAEDVDLSWRIRALGYKLKYCPKATITHYSYENAGEVKPNQYLNSVINNLLLRYRFGTFKEVLKGNLMLLSLMRHKGPFEHSRKMLLKKYVKHFGSIYHFRKWKRTNKNVANDFQPKFLGWDYEIIREGAFYKNEYPKNEPLVSIIVRTCGRPTILRETLISLRNQTYKNMQVVVVEDGQNISEKMIRDEFGDMNILYQATGEKVGRSKAGNIAMDTAEGKYLNFLDDDDLFYADHIEVLVKNLEESELDAAYSLAYETPIIVESKDPYVYQEVFHSLIYRQPFSKLLLFHHNFIPIQCIMFKKELFINYGGLDETLDALEDWDLWVKYALHTEFGYIPKVTSLYRVPFDRSVSAERQATLDEALSTVREKHNSYITQLSANDLAMQLQAVLDSYTLKISNEVMGKIEKRIPLLYRLILGVKSYIKKVLR